MPELPEVETVCQGLNQLTLNQEIEGGDVLLARTIAYPFSVDEFVAACQHVTITSWHRRGKYLLAELTNSEMTGAREQSHSKSTSSRCANKTQNSKFKIQNSKLPNAGCWVCIYE